MQSNVYHRTASPLPILKPCLRVSSTAHTIAAANCTAVKAKEDTALSVSSIFQLEENPAICMQLSCSQFAGGEKRGLVVYIIMHAVYACTYIIISCWPSLLVACMSCRKGNDVSTWRSAFRKVRMSYIILTIATPLANWPLILSCLAWLYITVDNYSWLWKWLEECVKSVHSKKPITGVVAAIHGRAHQLALHLSWFPCKYT